MKSFSTVVKGLILFLCCAGLLGAGSVPLTYNAPTDLLPRAKPPLPALGPAGTVIADPTFGSRIARATDAYSVPNDPNQSYHTPSGGWTNTWNTDGTLFAVENRGRMIPFRFDPVSMRASRIPDPSGAQSADGGLWLKFNPEGTFSYRQPNIYYGMQSLAVVQFDFNTNQYTRLFSATQAVPGVGGANSSVSTSDDDTKFAFAFGGGGTQNTWIYVIVWNRATGGWKLLNTQNSTINGQPAGTALPSTTRVHSCYLDRSGRYVVIGTWGGASDWLIWDTQTGGLGWASKDWSGHDVCGFGIRINQDGYSGAFYEPFDFVKRSLDIPTINQTSLLIPPDKLPSRHNGQIGVHMSWNNAQANAMVPMVASTYKLSYSDPWRAWDDEVVAVATDGSGTVWRFAHTRSTYGGNFWATPRANISQNGRFAIFTSNWEGHLGNEPNGTPRQDVFVVELAAGSTTPTTPSSPPPTTPPPTTPTVFSPIRVNAGGGAYTDPQGNVWSADTGYAGGTTFVNNWTPLNAPTPVLYQTERYGNMTYQFAVPNGTYTVNLKFAEIWFVNAGQRRFNVAINGQQVLTNFDIVAAAGATAKAIDKQFTVNVQNGRIAIQFTSLVDNAKISAIEILQGQAPTPPPASFSTIRVNAGGPAYTDPQGKVWSADTGFAGGQTFVNDWTPLTASTPVLYQTERYGNMTYQFAVPNGTYTVNLKFIEIWFLYAGNRVFNVAINGQQVLTNFDIVAAAGATAKAIDKQFTVNVQNGQVAIQFTSIVNNAKISAIEILQGQAAGTSPTLALPVRVNVGGTALTDSQGVAWMADTGFAGGYPYYFGPVPVSNTPTPELYQTGRWGLTGYNFAVPNGTYVVKLRFAEIFYTQRGQRVFNVALNGTQVLSNFDVLAQAGGKGIALDKQFTVGVSSGQISIQFSNVVDYGMVSAIEILKM